MKIPTHLLSLYNHLQKIYTDEYLDKNWGVIVNAYNYQTMKGIKK